MYTIMAHVESSVQYFLFHIFKGKILPVALFYAIGLYTIFAVKGCSQHTVPLGMMGG